GEYVPHPLELAGGAERFSCAKYVPPAKANWRVDFERPTRNGSQWFSKAGARRKIGAIHPPTPTVCSALGRRVAASPTLRPTLQSPWKRAAPCPPYSASWRSMGSASRLTHYGPRMQRSVAFFRPTIVGRCDWRMAACGI